MEPEALPTEDALTRLDAMGPVFVFGCPRSGTTFLYDALARLPRFYGFSGLPWSDRFFHLLGSGILGPAEKDLLWALRDVLWKGVVERHSSRGQAALDAFRGREGPRDAWSRRRRPPTDYGLVYKDPFAGFAVPQLARHFPSARFVHIIRDGRDCADSMLRTYPHALSDEVLGDPVRHREKGSEIGVVRRWKGWHVPWWVAAGAEADFIAANRAGRYLWLWQELVARSRTAGAALDPSRYLEIRYEALCREPPAVGRRLAEFTGRVPGWRFRRHLARADGGSIGVYGGGPAADATAHGEPLLGALGYSSAGKG